MALLNQINQYSEDIGWANRLVCPLVNIDQRLPVPIFFNNGGYLPGEILGMGEFDTLILLSLKRDGMLHYQ